MQNVHASLDEKTVYLDSQDFKFYISYRHDLSGDTSWIAKYNYASLTLDAALKYTNTHSKQASFGCAFSDLEGYCTFHRVMPTGTTKPYFWKILLSTM